MIPPEELLTGTRWKILESVTKKGPKTASEIARETKVTLPAISQAMKLLEAYGYISAKKQKRSGPGKPSVEYELKKKMVTIGLCLPGLTKKTSYMPSPAEEAELRTFFLPKKDRYWLLKLLCSQESIVEDCQAIGLVRSDEKETHLFVITEKVDAFRKEHANIHLTGTSELVSKDGKEAKQKIVIWSHTLEEVQEGLERREDYFVDLIKNSFPFSDQEGIIIELQEELEAKK